jgi:hypothetical protein
MGARAPSPVCSVNKVWHTRMQHAADSGHDRDIMQPQQWIAIGPHVTFNGIMAAATLPGSALSLTAMTGRWLSPSPTAGGACSEPDLQALTGSLTCRGPSTTCAASGPGMYGIMSGIMCQRNRSEGTPDVTSISCTLCTN